MSHKGFCDDEDSYICVFFSSNVEYGQERKKNEKHWSNKLNFKLRNIKFQELCNNNKNTKKKKEIKKKLVK